MERTTSPEGREGTRPCSRRPWNQTAQMQPGEKAPGSPQQGAWGRAWSLQPVRDQRTGCGISGVKCKGGSRASSVTCSWQCQMACRVRGSAKPRWQGLPTREQVGGRQSSGSCWSWGTPPCQASTFLLRTVAQPFLVPSVNLTSQSGGMGQFP